MGFCTAYGAATKLCTKYPRENSTETGLEYKKQDMGQCYLHGLWRGDEVVRPVS